MNRRWRGSAASTSHHSVMSPMTGKDGGSEDRQAIHVFDLAQLYTKPPAESLLKALALLKLAPPSWDASDDEEAEDSGGDEIRPREPPRPSVNPDGVPKYLTGIVASPLHWIEDEATQELIWELASQRLAERSGRTGMGSMTRSFKVPLPMHLDERKRTIEISMHEPSLTGDSLGHKTWVASYLLAKRLSKLTLPVLTSDVSPNVSLQSSTFTSPQSSGSSLAFAPNPCKILELGSGTGLLGLAAAAVFGQPVLLTDLAEIVPNLAQNVSRNRPSIQGHTNEFVSMNLAAGILDWTEPHVCRVPDSNGNSDQWLSPSAMTFPVILAADSLYSSSHAQLLCTAITTWLTRTPVARVVTEFPLRQPDRAIRDDFRSRMEQAGLRVLEEGTEEGRDDWDRKDKVRCWWSVWGW